METNYISKPWGYEQVVQNGRLSDDFMKELPTIKTLVVFKGQCLSLQTHKKRSEMWDVKYGECFIYIGGVRYDAFPGTYWHIPVGKEHRICANTNTVIEETCYNYDESDIIRIEDMYGRI